MTGYIESVETNIGKLWAFKGLLWDATVYRGGKFDDNHRRTIPAAEVHFDCLGLAANPALDSPAGLVCYLDIALLETPALLWDEAFKDAEPALERWWDTISSCFPGAEKLCPDLDKLPPFEMGFQHDQASKTYSH